MVEGVSSVDEQYRASELLLMEIRTQLEALESRSAHVVSGEVAANINQLSRQTADLESRVAAESLGELWRARVRQLGAECNALRKSLYAYMDREAAIERQAAERQALLEGAGRDEETLTSRQTRLTYLLEEGAALDNAGMALDQTLMTGSAILGGLETQKETMRRLQGKLKGMLLKLGVSKETMNRFERRARTDKLLVYGGLAGILLLIIVLFFFFRS